MPAVLLSAAAVLVGCTSGSPHSVAAPPTPAQPALEISHVHGVGTDPADGSLLLATHEGLFRVTAEGQAELASPVMDLMGFTVAGAEHFLASGHPGLRVDLPQPMGLIESIDGGRTWSPVSRQGQSDFHALTTGAAGVLGYDGALLRSDDGRDWEQLSIPAEPHSLAASPDTDLVLATTAQGLLRSADAGSTWSAVDGAPLLQVVDWADDGMHVAGVDPSGVIWISSDGGASWSSGADLASPPQAVAVSSSADEDHRITVVTAATVVTSTDGGRTFEVVLEQ
ncbi:F510_1955 family glycosylhydrolase [Blastococcus atacamensis]|uniref:F510_1955 family glycosylhydrolase n=1 Tax=Blastococcus atacamensis TaxID=2070508 RepID=UPI001E45F197|nr:exo-alpha-sialidase [Blastococcus atacamensis]